VKKHLTLSYITQVYSSFLGIIMMPYYLAHIGAEAFGLIGFSIMLQGWIQILDLGMSPALSRAMSCFRAGYLSSQEMVIRLRTLELLQGALGLLAGALILIASPWIGSKWLSADGMSASEITAIIGLIAIASILRWIAGIYRAALIGLEKQHCINGLTITFTTLRYIGVVPLLVYVSTSPIFFFVFQACVSGLEISVAALSLYRFVPFQLGTKPSRKAIKDMLPLASGMAFLSAVWIIVTQIDKLVLSGLLPLDQYGNFMLAVTMAGNVLLLIPPINQVVQPRMTILVERGEEKKLEEIYRLSSQLAVVGFLGLGGGLSFFAEPILEIWSGNNEVAYRTAPVLFWYGLANSVTGILLLPFMLQFAKGQLHLHITLNIISFFTFVPAIGLAAAFGGPICTGQVLLVGNVLILLIWIPIVHKRFMPAVNWQGLFRDISLPGLVTILPLAVLSQVVRNSIYDGTVLLPIIGLSCLTAIAAGIASGTYSRRFIIDLIRGPEK
jgi:O-antigen/teichoic acid export membrane protein